jgi:hypothetical protein
LSVVDPRPAAAQRTAARRVRIVATWLFIVPLLSCFSFSVVAGASGFGKPSIAAAVSKLPDTTHVVEVTVGKDKDPKDDHDPNLNALVERFSHSDHYVCSVSASQLVLIQRRWRTGRTTISVRSRPLDLVEVYNASEPDLRTLLGARQVKCELVRISSIFFLPFDAHTS